MTSPSRAPGQPTTENPVQVEQPSAQLPQHFAKQPAKKQPQHSEHPEHPDLLEHSAHHPSQPTSQPQPESPAYTQASSKQIRRWRRHLAEERNEAETYRVIAAKRTGEERQVLLSLAAAEGRHEAHWLELLGPHAYPAPKPGFRSRLTARLARVFGVVVVLAMMQRSEQRTSYDSDSDATPQMAADEHIHGEVVRSLIARSRQALAGTFRAAIFGANDGLVSNLALVMGVAATGMSSSMVLATGIAGLLAGALSMGAGEWVSVSSQKELLDASIPDPEADRSVPHLDFNANELALVFRARGESEESANAHAARALELAQASGASSVTGGIAVRAALRPDPGQTMGAGEEIGTPMRAGLSSFCFFSMGALVPLIPFIFGISGNWAILTAALIVGVVLLITGSSVGILSGQPAWPRALRQLAIGFAAAAITYGLGRLFSVAGLT